MIPEGMVKLAQGVHLSLLRRVLQEAGPEKCRGCYWESKEERVKGAETYYVPGCIHPRSETGAVDPCPLLED